MITFLNCLIKNKMSQYQNFIPLIIPTFYQLLNHIKQQSSTYCTLNWVKKLNMKFITNKIITRSILQLLKINMSHNNKSTAIQIDLISSYPTPLHENCLNNNAQDFKQQQSNFGMQ